MRVRIELSLPGEDVVVSHAPALHSRVTDTSELSRRKMDEIDAVHKDAAVAIHEAFDAARRRLQDAARKQRGDVKAHRRVLRSRGRSAAPIARPLEIVQEHRHDNGNADRH